MRLISRQKDLLRTWKGQYDIVSTLQEILDIMCIDTSKLAAWGFTKETIE